MKKMIAFGTVLLFCLCLANANATLIKETNSTGTVVYDDVADLYWLQNTQFLVAYSYADQLTKIAALNSSSYFGITTWEMATLDAMNQLWQNPASEFLAFYRTYVEGGTDYYYGRYDSATGTESHFTARVVNPIWVPANSKMDKKPLETSGCQDKYSYQTAPGGGPGYPAAWVFADLSVMNPDPPIANPEPGTLLLLSSGFLLWALSRKRVKN
jgi:hypothetical protein